MKHFFQTKSLQSMDIMLQHVYTMPIPQLLKMHLNPILLNQFPIGIAHLINYKQGDTLQKQKMASPTTPTAPMVPSKSLPM